MTRLLATPCVLAAFLSAGVLAASAGDLTVSPKNGRTVYRSHEGTYSPKRLRYRVGTTDGKRRWSMGSTKKLFTASPPSGTARKRPRPVIVTPEDARIRTRAPGIYNVRLIWRPKGPGSRARIGRNVTLIVEGDPAAGLTYFNATCSGCHDLYINKNGPRLIDVYGRKAGTVSDFSYSSALVAYGKTWDEKTLNDWLKNPQKAVPGVNMYLSVSDPVDRMNVIAYLKQIAP